MIKNLDLKIVMDLSLTVDIPEELIETLENNDTIREYFLNREHQKETDLFDVISQEIQMSDLYWDEIEIININDED